MRGGRAGEREEGKSIRDGMGEVCHKGGEEERERRGKGTDKRESEREGVQGTKGGALPALSGHKARPRRPDLVELAPDWSIYPPRYSHKQL